MEETRRFSEELSDILQMERNFSIHDTDYAWDISSMKEEKSDEKKIEEPGNSVEE